MAICEQIAALDRAEGFLKTMIVGSGCARPRIIQNGTKLVSCDVIAAARKQNRVRLAALLGALSR
jgi:hypothetical protein